MAREPTIAAVRTSVCTIPTEAPESDGTLEWNSTTAVIVEIEAGGEIGLGYTYGSAAVAALVTGELVPALDGQSAFRVRAAWNRMNRALRNAGRRGAGAMAIAAVDTALWDLKARLLGVPLVSLLGQVREDVPIYGSGGFTSLTEGELRDQLGGWVAQGMAAVKMKVGRDATADERRVLGAREAIGPEAALFVDANGAYRRKEALRMAESFAPAEVTWFEEPVSSEDLEGLRLLRDRAPPGMRIAAGEYGAVASDFRSMLDAGAVDVLMADATRCAGFTGLLDVAALARAYEIPLSTHTAPALHVHPACAITEVVNLEYFHDHVQVEEMLFEGVPRPQGGRLRPFLDRPGHGLALKKSAAARFAA